MTHLPRLPTEAAPAFAALDQAFRDLRDIVWRDGFVGWEIPASNIADLSAAVLQVREALVAAGAERSVWDWQAFGATEHSARSLLTLGPNANVPNVRNWLLYGAGELRHPELGDHVNWHRIGKAIDAFAEAVLAAMKPDAEQDGLRLGGIVVYQNMRTKVGLSKTQAKLFGLVWPVFPAGRIPREDILARMYEGRRIAKGGRYALSKLVSETNAKLVRVRLKVENCEEAVWLREMNRVSEVGANAPIERV
jgi:hypothetical protein